MKALEDVKHMVSESYHSKHPQNENAKLVSNNVFNEKSSHRNRYRAWYEK